MRKNSEEKLRSKITEALGEASLCWSETPGGTFETSKIEKIIERLLEEVKKEMPKYELLVPQMRKLIEEKEVKIYYKGRREYIGGKIATRSALELARFIVQNKNDILKEVTTTTTSTSTTTQTESTTTTWETENTTANQKGEEELKKERTADDY
jgi:hypothetical protein